MPKIKTSELTGPALDWAVTRARLEGEVETTFYIDHKGRVMEESGDLSWVYSPSADWSQGGPIIEREDINVARHTHSEITESQQEIYRKDGWTAFTTTTAYWMTPTQQFGPTPLIAAMRCYVAAALGDEVDVPEELLA